MAGSLWDSIRAERSALAADLAGLDDAAWATPSLCDGWTVRDVLAHMTATAKMTPGAFFGKLVSSGFKLTKLQEKDMAVERGATPAETLSRFESIVGSTKHPPGPGPTWLGEVVVHSQDIRRPLGIPTMPPPELAAQVADFYKGSNLIIGAKKRIAGVSLRATDTAWSHGEGPELAGPIVSIVLAMTGRKAALTDLTGDGVAVLAARD